jgi:hypothetical protein
MQMVVVLENLHALGFEEAILVTKFIDECVVLESLMIIFS